MTDAATLEITTPSDRELAMGGVYREIAAPDRLVVTEVFDDPWYPGKGVGTRRRIGRDRILPRSQE